MTAITIHLSRAKEIVRNCKLCTPVSPATKSAEEKEYRRIAKEKSRPPFYNTPARYYKSGYAVPYAGTPQKSSHNSYQREDTMFTQYEKYNITSFELDIHNGDHGFDTGQEDNAAKDGNYYVYHDSWHPLDTHYTFLSDALADIERINSCYPDHDVITIHVDLKDKFNVMGLMPNDLDERLREELGDMLYTPADLLDENNTNSLSDAYNEGKGMPPLADLEGRVIIVLTGDKDKLEDYIAQSNNPVAFISPNLEVKDGKFIPNPDAIFYNTDNIGNATVAANEGYMTRVYDIDNEEEYVRARNAGITHIATDYISVKDL